MTHPDGHPPQMADDPEEVLGGGATNVGSVVRVGDTVRRPRTASSPVVEAFLVHLEEVGFDGAPRFRGVDEEGRQVLTFVAGDVTPDPPWQLDDDANAAHLASTARLLRRLHQAGDGFVPPPGTSPRRTCPVPGTTWLHADAHYGNIVFRDNDAVALIDWDFAAQGDALYDPISLLVCTRQPRSDRPEERAERERSARRALSAILDAYHADHDQRRRAPIIAAEFFAGAADYLAELDDGVDRTDVVANRRDLAGWWRTEAVR